MKLIKGKVMGRWMEAAGLLDPGPALCRFLQSSYRPGSVGCQVLQQPKENQMLSTDT